MAGPRGTVLQPLGANAVRRSLVVAACIGMALVALPAGAQTESPPTPVAEKAPPPLSAQEAYAWSRSWPIYGRLFAAVGDDYVGFESFNAIHGSSRHITVAQVMRRETVTVRRRMGPGVVRPVQLKPLRADCVAAANSLPRVAVGEYGYIQSFVVKQVLGPEDAVIGDIWLIDAHELNQLKDTYRDKLTRKARGREIDSQIKGRYRLRDKLVEQQKQSQFKATIRLQGISTDDMVEQTRWVALDQERGGLQIAIIGVDRSDNEGSARRFLAAPARLFRRSLSRDQFVDMLQKRGLDQRGFLEWLDRLAQDNPRTVKTRVVRTLSTGRPVRTAAVENPEE